MPAGPLNTIAQTLGYVVEAESGRVAITLGPTSAHLNPSGTVHGGLTATLLDSCMGLAIRWMLEKGVGSTTLEFKISLVRVHHARDGSDQGRGQSPQLRQSCRHGRRSRHRRQEPIARARYDDVPYFPELMRSLHARPASPKRAKARGVHLGRLPSQRRSATRTDCPRRDGRIPLRVIFDRFNAALR